MNGTSTPYEAMAGHVSLVTTAHQERRNTRVGACVGHPRLTKTDRYAGFGPQAGDAGVISAAVLVGRNRGEGAEGPGGERAAARGPRGRGHLPGPPRPSLRLPRPGPAGPGGRAGLPGPGPVRRPAGRRLPAGTRRDERA